jgi:hypothetical protein
LTRNTPTIFYVNKLGFKVNTDAVMGAKGRWLTVNPPEQPEVELTLIAIDEKMMFDKESVARMRELIAAGTFGFAALECDDMLATYEELKAKGVNFKKESAEELRSFRRFSRRFRQPVFLERKTESEIKTTAENRAS